MSPRRELLHQFLKTFFDSEALTTSGEWKKTAAGVLAAFLSAGIVVFQTYWLRYEALNSPAHSTAALYRSELRSDLLLFIGLAFAVTAVLTLLQWQSLFPKRCDCLAFAGLPIGARDIFVTKSGALLILFTGYVLSIYLPWAILFTTVISGPWQENPSALVLTAATFLTIAAACCSAFSILLALQGVLLNLLPARVFETVGLWIQGVLFITTLGALPLAGRQPDAEWWPGMWFLHLWESIVRGDLARARAALLSIMIPAVAASTAYLAGYHRHQRILLEASIRRHRSGASGKLAGFGSRLLETWIRRPQEQAAFAFIWKTLVRSRGHRLLLLAWAGLAAGWIVNGILNMPTPSLKNEGVYGMIVTVSPLALALLAIIALRHLFSLPVAHNAKWIFEIAEYGGAEAWLSAVERFVLCCGVAPVCVAGLPACVAVLGWQRAVIVTALVFLVAALWFEALFRNWRKLPFTCSRVAPRRPFAITLVRYGLAGGLLAAVASLILYCSLEPAALFSLFTLLVWSIWRMRRKRRGAWRECHILYQELDEPEVSPLRLEDIESPAPAVASGPARREAEFDFHLTASRPAIAESLTGEIAESIHNQTFVDSVLGDLRHGLRLIRRDPVLSLVIIATLTAAIGINASVFTVVNGYFLRPHITNAPATFIQIIPAAGSIGSARGATYAEYRAFRNGARSLRLLAAFYRLSVVLGQQDVSSEEEIRGLGVSCNFFAVEGVARPKLGRLFVEDDCRAPGQPPVAILSEATWRSRFASDPGIIGRVIRINNRPVPVVGVVATTTSGWLTGPPVSVWVPYTAQPYFDPALNLFKEDEHFWLELAGRIAPGYNRAAVRAEFTRLVRAQDRMDPGRVTRIETTDGSWIEWIELFADARFVLLSAFFFGAFNLVLLIACANVATLLLSRAATRNREIAVRLSFGAPRSRLVRMLITESLVLAVVAGALSWIVVNKLSSPLAHYLTLRSFDFSLVPDWRVLTWISVLVLTAGILAGIAPAMEALKVDLISSLKGFGGLIGGVAGTKRSLGYLVSAQVALSMVLIVGAGLLGEAENRNLHANPGYDSRHIAVVMFQRPAPLQVIKDRLLSIPGVRSAAFSRGVPLLFPDTVEISPPERPDAVQPVAVLSAAPRFFETMGIPLVGGREFHPSEINGAIVSQTLARLFWHNRSPLGQRLRLPDGTALTVVGIAKDIDPLWFGGTDNPPLYRSLARHAGNTLVVRFYPGLKRPALSVGSAIHEIEPNLAVRIRLMQKWIDEVSTEIWNFVSLILLLGILATILSMTGIYGAVGFAVNQSTREFGIRAALGARRLDIVRSVYSAGGRPVLHGLLVGVWLSVATAAALNKTLDTGPLRIDSSDPLLYIAAVALLAIAAMAAMLLPALRGAHSAPIEALRYD
ncbi:MAG TPA: ABC transporter permease [Bryobacteraceae bacterium]|jgi:predicted permease|nr:ABC transporter permease [Bryobacteraceae bacterium]